MTDHAELSVEAVRRTDANDHPLRPDGNYVLYWMIASRRTRWNHALQHAVDRAADFGKPLIVFEPIRIRYDHASDRIHHFVCEGMRSNAGDCAGKNVTYYPYVEPAPGRGTPLLHRLAKNACTVVTDEYPCFFIPHMIQAVRDRIPARLELVDSNGVLPLRWADRTFTVAHSYRRAMQKVVMDHITEPPRESPLDDDRLPPPVPVPDEILRRWPAADLDALIDGDAMKSLPIDHTVPPSPTLRGGGNAASIQLRKFLDGKLDAYNADRNHPDEVATTTLSPHLHFGHISAHEVVAATLDRVGWDPSKVGKVNGKINGFWNAGESAEGLLDQLLTWREMGFNLSFREPDQYDRYQSLPEWARNSLEAAEADEREYTYCLEDFEYCRTHDELWNAAQAELVRTGIMHNYMRMLWGKKILHWTATPKEALRVMLHLNNKYALDGRDPNSYSGIFWVLGRYDRAWGPKRKIFGSVRYMTSDSTRKKLRLRKYLQRYGERSAKWDGT